MATECIEIKSDQAIKTKSKQLKEVAPYQVLPEHEEITVKDDVFDRFVAACEHPKRPNKALLDAVAFTKTLGYRELWAPRKTHFENFPRSPLVTSIGDLTIPTLSYGIGGLYPIPQPVRFF